MEPTLEAIRDEAITQNKAFGKGRLRDELRMKPKPDAEPSAWVKNPYNNSKYAVYLVSDCVPLRERKSKPRTEKQLAADKKLAAQAKLKSNEAKAGKKALKWLEDECLTLDTETTGLGHEAQIIELAIVDHQGNKLFEQRFNPSVDIEPRAEEVHGLSNEMLLNEPKWPEKIEQIKALLLSRPVIIFNADFDLGMLYSTTKAFGLDTSWVNEVSYRCAMKLSAEAFGATNPYGTISLATAADCAAVKWQGDAHGALSDTLATRDVVAYLADYYRQLELQTL